MKGPRGELRGLGLAPARRRSQNFLKDSGAAARMAALVLAEAGGREEAAAGGGDLPEASAAGRGPLVLEVGPGLGALTRPLLALGLAVCAVELDRGLCAGLAGWPEASSGALELLNKDILKVDAPADLPPGIACVCGNLPYGISTPFLFWFLEAFGGRLPGVFMLQREVAARLAAPPGGKEYGRLAVGLGSWFSAREAFSLGPGAFHPRPRVESSVAVLRPLAARPAVTPAALGSVTKACFHSRRKTLFNNLAAAYPREAVGPALAAAGMEGGRRPEEFPPEAYQRLTAALAGPAGAPGGGGGEGGA